MVKVITQHEVAHESFDHQFPCGAVNDNHSSHELIQEIMKTYGDNPKVLDIGCAGGQFIIDCNSIGCTAVGIEGSSSVSTDEKAHGYHNWQAYKGKYLFHANATKDYSIVDTETNEMIKFDLISAWEVIEHIEETDLEMFFEQIHKHLSDTGVFIGSISLVTCYDPVHKVDLHRTVKPKEWWHDFLSKKFEILDYPFNSYLRELGYNNFSICMRKK
jgi:cyclopropane fatty-acyl-phospholipid synthase-like methyltransferase